MLYLIVTGKSSAYLDDIYTTLSLPAGVQHCYKFPFSSNSLTVAENAEEKECGRDEPVLVSYFDRDGDSAERYYIPLRCGRLKSCKREEEQFYYDVLLQEHCHAENEGMYSKHILEEFGNQTRHKDENGECKGVLAIRNDMWEDGFIVKDSGCSWKRTVQRLADRKLFSQYYSVFTKIEFLDGKGETVNPTDRKEYGYELIVGKEYGLKLSYYIPEFDTDTMSTIRVCLEDSRDVCGLLKKEAFMESKQGRVLFKLWPVHKAEMLLTSLALSISDTKIGTREIRYSKKAVDVKVRSRIRKGGRYIVLGFCMLVICGASILNAIPYENIIKDVEKLQQTGNTLSSGKELLYKVSMMLDSYKYVYSSVCGVLNTVATFFLVKFTGKAKL